MAISEKLFSALPERSGLYDPAFEHDACGVAMVATLNKEATHEIVQQGLEALRNLDHRGASGAEVNSGDGAGILIRVPDRFLRTEVQFDLPIAGDYAVGIAFLPKDFQELNRLDDLAKEEGLRVLGWRSVPINSSSLGATALSVMPDFKMLFLAGLSGESGIALDRLAFCFRKRVEHQLPIYFASLSAQTIVYKGMLTTHQLSEFFPDLNDPKLHSPFALVHSRFSTNTFHLGHLPTHIDSLRITVR